MTARNSCSSTALWTVLWLTNGPTPRPVPHTAITAITKQIEAAPADRKRMAPQITKREHRERKYVIPDREAIIRLKIARLVTVVVRFTSAMIPLWSAASTYGVTGTNSDPV